MVQSVVDGIREMRERNEAMDPSVVRVYDESISLFLKLVFAAQPVVQFGVLILTCVCL